MELDNMLTFVFLYYLSNFHAVANKVTNARQIKLTGDGIIWNGLSFQNAPYISTFFYSLHSFFQPL